MDGSATGLNTGLYNGQTKTYATALAVPYGLRTIKRFEEAADGVFGYAGTWSVTARRTLAPSLRAVISMGPAGLAYRMAFLKTFESAR